MMVQIQVTFEAYINMNLDKRGRVTLRVKNRISILVEESEGYKRKYEVQHLK